MIQKPSRLSIGALCGIGALALLALAGPAAAQFNSVTTPPSGGNQRETVSQQIGLVRVSVDYSSPHVHSPAGVDRKGKIWGELVPYGMANLGFGTCGSDCPWRGGANENTVFTTSHNITVQGKPLPAGAYGLHFLPGKDEWTVVFSKISTSWGSFFYDAKEDALRVQAKPETVEYREVLTYDFTERKLDTATLALKWENLALPLVLKVDNALDLYVENMARELRSSPGFAWQSWQTAANFCLENKTHLDQGLAWAQRSIDPAGGVGQENFTTLATLSALQAATGHADDAGKTMQRAINHPTAMPIDLHFFGRRLLAEKKPQEALKVFELNAKNHPGAWPVDVGLARGYAAVGRTQDALAAAKRALLKAPDEANKKTLEGIIKKLEAGQPIE